VGALAWAAYREANPYVPDGSAKTNAARAELLRYEERLRGQADLSEARYMRACEEAQRAEEATARVERLEKALAYLHEHKHLPRKRTDGTCSLCGATRLEGGTGVCSLIGCPDPGYDVMLEAGVPTSAADGGAK